VQNGVDGVLVEVAADPESQELARQANGLLTDEAARRRTAEAGRRRAARFDWAGVTGEVLELYARLRGDTAVSPARAQGA
jgi:glycosyltransferase involved in cell wall biosynthesis